jgi:hypothetical protein
LNRLHRAEVPAPSVANPWAPPVFDLIVIDMLRHDPAARLPTAAEVQRRIAIAAPGAANRDAAELGALVRDIRERRAAKLAAEATEVSSSLVSIPPATRSRPPSLGHGVEVEPAPASGARRLETERVTTPRRLMWHRVLLVAACLSVLGVVADVLIERRGERFEASARAAPSHRDEIELVEVSTPTVASGPPPAQSPPPRESGDVAASPPLAAAIPTRAVRSALAVPAHPPAQPASPACRGPRRPPARAPMIQGTVHMAAPTPSAPQPSSETGRLTPKLFDDPDNERSTDSESDR